MVEAIPKMQKALCLTDVGKYEVMEIPVPVPGSG